MATRERCLEWLTKVVESDNNYDTTALHDDNSAPLRGDDPLLLQCGFERHSSPHDSAYQGVPQTSRKRKRQDQDHDREHELHTPQYRMPQIPHARPHSAQTQDVDEVIAGVGCSTLADEDEEATATQTKRGKKRRINDDLALGESASAASSSRSSTTSNANSPVKQMNRLRTLERPIVDGYFSDADLELPEIQSKLYWDLETCHSNQNIVPTHFKYELRREHKDPVWCGEDIWKKDELPLSRLPTLDELKAIQQEAIDLKNQNEFEAAWNTHCHGPLLVLARRLSPHHRSIRCVNITQARLHNRLYADSGSGKMVDFGLALLVLESDQRLKAALASLPIHEDGTRYCNHTLHPPLAINPLAISIETKRADADGTTAKFQLRVWAAAQMAWFAEVRKAPLPLQIHDIYLPLLVAIGSRWEWQFARGEFEPDTGALKRTVIFQQQPIGDVSSLAGLFAVLEAFRLLFEWVHKHWKPQLIQWLGG